MTKAEQILAALGGDANVLDLEPCITRLRVEVENPSLVDERGPQGGRRHRRRAVRRGRPGHRRPRGGHARLRHRGPALMATLTVLSPVSGQVLGLSEVADPVFSAELVGPGLALDPAARSRLGGHLPHRRHHREAAPARVRRAARRRPRGARPPRHRHRRARRRRVHAARRRGSGRHRGTGRRQLGPVRRCGGRSPVCPVVGLEAGADALTRLARPGDTVAAGEPLLSWA